MEDSRYLEAVEICRAPRKASSFIPTEDLIFSPGSKRPMRNIFSNQQYLDFEVEKLNRLKQEITKDKIKVPPNWDDAVLLRIIHGSDYKTRKAVNDLKKSIATFEKYFSTPLSAILPKVLEVLQTGFMYIHGRDKFFRPAIVLLPGRVNVKRFSGEIYLEAVIFIMQFMVENMMIPGKAETWVNIVDVESTGITQLPMKSLMRIAGAIKDLFKCRLAHMFVTNPPSSIWLMWKMISPFMDSVTKSKVNFMKKGLTEEVKSFYHPSQLEKRFGGDLEDVQQYWPPVVPPYKGKIERERVRENSLGDVIPNSEVERELENVDERDLGGAGITVDDEDFKIQDDQDESQEREEKKKSKKKKRSE